MTLPAWVSTDPLTIAIALVGFALLGFLLGLIAVAATAVVRRR